MALEQCFSTNLVDGFACQMVNVMIGRDGCMDPDSDALGRYTLRHCPTTRLADSAFLILRQVDDDRP
jgi:hypothetical protein